MRNKFSKNNRIEQQVRAKEIKLGPYDKDDMSKSPLKEIRLWLAEHP